MCIVLICLLLHLPYLFMFLVVPVLLLNCSCGGAAGGIGHPNYFADLPFETKESLIYYHTEGPGEDRVKYSTIHENMMQQKSSTYAQ